MEMKIQQQYDIIYAFFKNTTEPFDYLEWDGSILNVFFEDKIIETYFYEELCCIIKGL